MLGSRLCSRRGMPEHTSHHKKDHKKTTQRQYHPQSTVPLSCSPDGSLHVANSTKWLCYPKCLLWAKGNNCWTKVVCAAKQLHFGCHLREVLGCLATFKTQALVIRLYHMPTLSIFQETPLHQTPAAGAQPTGREGQSKYPLLLKHKQSKQTKEGKKTPKPKSKQKYASVALSHKSFTSCKRTKIS